MFMESDFQLYYSSSRGSILAEIRALNFRDRKSLSGN